MRISFSTRALARLEAVHTYIAARNPAAAPSVLGEIRRACDLIALQPQMGRAVPDLDLRFHVTRRFRYRIIYRVADDAVQVLDVLHPRQDWSGRR